jgi:cytochrome c-type biogenesis protein CcmH
MIWVVFAAMTGVAVFSVLWPLSARRRTPAANLPNISLYEAQVAEIDRDAASGLIAAEGISAAKADAARRLLAVASAEATPTPAQSSVRIAAVAAIVLIPALTLALYSRFGRPDLPDAPLAGRLQSTDPAKMDMAAAIVRIEAHLREHPDDGRGWDVIAACFRRGHPPPWRQRRARGGSRRSNSRQRAGRRHRRSATGLRKGQCRRPGSRFSPLLSRPRRPPGRQAG